MSSRAARWYTGPDLRAVRPPFARAVADLSPAPALGEHTDEVLRGLLEWPVGIVRDGCIGPRVSFYKNVKRNPRSGDHGARLDCRPRGARPQPPEYRRRPAPGPPRGHHRALGVGQVVAGVRHHLRRRPAAVRRVAVGLRPPVPRADGEAGRRSDRRPVAGDLDRAENHRLEPALDGRHRHRDLRLSAAALRQHRRSALPELRSRDLLAVARADPGHGHALSARRAHQRAGAGRARPEGGVQARAGGAAGARVHPRAHRRPVRRARGRRRPRSAQEPHDRRAGRPADRQVGHRAPARRFDRARAQARRRHRRHQHARGRRSAVLAPDGVPVVRHQHSRDDAARVFVQLAAWRVPGLPGPRRGLRLRSGAHRARRWRVARGRRDRAVGERRPPAHRRDAAGPRAHVRDRPADAVLRSCRKKLRDIVLFGAPGRRGQNGPRPKAKAEGRSGSQRHARKGSVRRWISKARFRTCAAGSRRAPGTIRRASSPTARCSRARSATATGCGPRAARCA